MQAPLRTCSCCTFMAGGSKPSDPRTSALLPAARSAACTPGHTEWSRWVSASRGPGCRPAGRLSSGTTQRAQRAPTALAASSSDLSFASASARSRFSRSSSLAAERAFCAHGNGRQMGGANALQPQHSAPALPPLPPPRHAAPLSTTQQSAPAAAHPPHRCGWPGSRHPQGKLPCALCAAAAPCRRLPAAGRRTRRRAPTAGTARRSQAGIASVLAGARMRLRAVLLAAQEGHHAALSSVPHSSSSSSAAPTCVQPDRSRHVAALKCRAAVRVRAAGSEAGWPPSCGSQWPPTIPYSRLSACTDMWAFVSWPGGPGRQLGASSRGQRQPCCRAAVQPCTAMLHSHAGGPLQCNHLQPSAPSLSSRQVSFLIGCSHSLLSFSPACKDYAPCIQV